MSPDWLVSDPHRERLLRLQIPIALTNNNDGQGHKWYRAKDERNRYKTFLEFLPGCVREPFDRPTFVVVTRVLGKGERQWDPSSVLRGNWKQIEDTLVEMGWWRDDSPRWIEGVYGNQDSSRRSHGPRTEVEVWSSHTSGTVAETPHSVTEHPHRVR